MGEKSLSLSDKLNQENLLRFYKPQGFQEVQPKDYNYDVAFEKQSLRSRKTKMHSQPACLVKMAIKRQSKIIRLRRRSFKKDNFWKGKRIIYEVKEVRTEPFIFEGIGSVLAIYQAFSLFY